MADITEHKTGPGTNTGHGHLWERPDGYKVRCGGPYLCSDCKRFVPEYGTTEQKANLAYINQRKAEADDARKMMESALPSDYQLHDTKTGEPKGLCTADDIIKSLNKVNASKPVRVVFCNPAEKDRIIQSLMDQGWIGAGTPDKIVVHASSLVEYGYAYVAPGPDPYKAASMSWTHRKPVD